MRKWGVVITLCYLLILVALLLPAWILLWGTDRTATPTKIMALYFSQWGTWIPVAMLVAGQALLLFLSVDTSQQRLKPRTHIRVSIIATALLLSLLSFATIFSLAVGILGDRFLLFLPPNYAADAAILLGSWAFLWLAWSIVFYIFYRDSIELVTRATSWLLKGSVLELIIAVVCHVIVRRRNDCCAPMITSFGIVTGIAIMLISFGPSVLFLLKKRMDARAPRPRPAP